MSKIFVIFDTMENFKLVIFSLVLVVFGSVFLTSCASTSYPCPGNGQMSAADLSQFDANGEPIDKKKKKNKNNGLVGKKQPKRLKRKTNLVLE